MGKNRFIYDLITREATISPLVASDYHPSFPVENLRNIWTSYYYRSKYGDNSGWGYFTITSSEQNLYFVDNGSTARTAVIAVGDYDGDSLAAEIETKMEAQTTDTFTVSYSDVSGKFTITDDTGTYELTCTNTSSSIWTIIGFSTASDKTGSASYIADSLRAHTYAGFILESGDSSAITCSACALFGLNLTSSYQILQLDRWTGSVWEKIGDFDFDYDNQRAIVMWTPSSSTKYRVLARDWTNPLRYFQCGVPVLGQYSEISRGYEYGASYNITDSSVHQFSKEGFLNVQRGFIRRARSVEYVVMSDDEDKLDELYYTYGMQEPLVFVKDSYDPENTMEYIIFAGAMSRREEDAYFKTIGLSWYEVK